MTILGLDPGTKEMGFAVLRDKTLLTFGVRWLRNGDRPYDVIGQARRAVLDLVRDHEPEIVAIERPLRIATKRGSLMQVIVEELKARSRDLALRVVELSPDEVRQAVAGDPRANKIAVARVIVESGYPTLRPLLPQPPKRAVLGLRPKDKYWLHMFDALAVALAVQHDSVNRAC